MRGSRDLCVTSLLLADVILTRTDYILLLLCVIDGVKSFRECGIYLYEFNCMASFGMSVHLCLPCSYVGNIWPPNPTWLLIYSITISYVLLYMQWKSN